MVVSTSDLHVINGIELETSVTHHSIIVFIYISLCEDSCNVTCDVCLLQMSTLKYETKMVVQRQALAGADDIIFKTFCSFRTHADVSFSGIGVVGYVDPLRMLSIR